MERHRRHSLTLSYRSLSCRSLYVVGRVELAGETANASLRQCAGHSESGGSSRSERDAQVNLRWRLPGSTSIQETRCWRTTSRRWPRAGTLGGAARVVDSSSSLEFERVVDAQIPRSRVHLRARAARHEHAAVRKSLTSERQRLICQASMNKVHGEVFDYTEAFSRNIGLASGRTTLLSVRSPRANVQDRLSAKRQSQPDSAGRAMVGSPYKPRSSRCCRETRALALSNVFCRWIGIGVTSVAAAIVTCHEVDVQKRAR